MATRYRTAWARRLPARVMRVVLQLVCSGVITALAGRPRVEGREHVAGLPGPLVVAANHSSHLDTTVVLNALPLRHRQRTLVVAAADYFYTDRIRAGIVSLAFGTIPVERGPASSTESTDRMHRLLEDGWNLLLYPEGTRSRDGRMGELQTGAAYLACTHHVPLVPIGVLGTHASLPPGAILPRRSRIRVRIGAPLDAVGDHHEVMQRLERQLRELSDQPVA